MPEHVAKMHSCGICFTIYDLKVLCSIKMKVLQICVNTKPENMNCESIHPFLPQGENASNGFFEADIININFLPNVANMHALTLFPGTVYDDLI